jgi:hypothetical protein
MASLIMSVNPDYPGTGVRYISKITTVDLVTGEQKPILELTEKGTTLHVSFVRSTPEYSLQSLLDTAMDFAKTHGFQRVELQDDAQFLTLGASQCIHRSLFHRAFEGKKGIYESKGWTPSADTGPSIKVISTFTTADAQTLVPLLQQVRPMPVDISAGDTPFGLWINSQPCPVLQYFYTTLLILSTRQWIEKVDAGSPARAFLEALYDIRHANDVLYKEPVYSEAKGGRRIRRRASKTQRASNQRRKSRSSRRNRGLSLGKILY